MPASSDTTSAIDNLFAEWDRTDAPGIAVGVVRDGVPIHARGFGLASVEHRVPVTASTVFDIASVTKQFTAFAILLLAQSGRLDLDGDLRATIPELPAYDPPVRIRHCLYHTSGLSDWIAALEFTGPTYDICLPKRAFRSIYALEETMFPAGAEHSYSNTGYVLLAKVVARVSGKPLPRYLDERVFAPLGMANTALFSDPDRFLADQAQGYYRNDTGGLRRVSWPNGVYGDGGMLTSVDDMVRWLRNFDRLEVGGAGLFEEFLAPGRLDNGQPIPYAAGWELESYRGLRVVRHGGMGPGFKTHIARFPEARLGIVVISNLNNTMPWPLANDVADICLRDELAGTQSAPKTPEPVKASPVDDFAGRYFTETGLPVTVRIVKHRLFLEVWYRGRRLVRQSDAVFKYDEDGETFTFHRGADGRVSHFTMQRDDGACPRLHSPLRLGVRIEAIALGRDQLARYEGRYISDELETIYTLRASDTGLTARHLRCDDWELRPVKSCVPEPPDDEFVADGSWPGKVRFERGPRGDVTGFRVRGTSVNLFFRRFPSKRGANGTF